MPQVPVFNRGSVRSTGLGRCRSYQQHGLYCCATRKGTLHVQTHICACSKPTQCIYLGQHWQSAVATSLTHTLGYLFSRIVLLRQAFHPEVCREFHITGHSAHVCCSFLSTKGDTALVRAFNRTVLRHCSTSTTTARQSESVIEGDGTAVTCRICPEKWLAQR